eukprot:m.355298 g.355298  ORF g.355298 m.355298 type:complete len:73 (+) comp17213_c0_seq1:2287-2505(+)
MPLMCLVLTLWLGIFLLSLQQVGFILTPHLNHCQLSLKCTYFFSTAVTGSLDVIARAFYCTARLVFSQFMRQ